MGRRPDRHPVRVPGRRHEAGAVVQELAVRAALAHRRPGALDARDALGADGSRRELSRAHSLHIASLHFRFFFSRVTVLCTTTAIALADSAAVCASSAFAQCVCFFFETTRCHFRSEVSCGSPVASASWASLRGGEPC